MSTPGKLELTVKIDRLPDNVRTIANGWKQFEIDLDGQIITLTLKPHVYKKLEQAQENYHQWVAKIIGQMGAKTDKGFLLKDCNVTVYSQTQSSPSKLQQKPPDRRDKPKKANSKFVEKYRLYTGETLNLFQIVFRLTQAVFPGVLPWVLVLSSYGFLISVLYSFGIPVSIPEESDAITRAVLIFNIGLPLLLVFRTNTAHEKFWEGRKLWGSLVNTVRNLTRDLWIGVKEETPQDRAQKEYTLRLIVAFAVAMKLHLRGEHVTDELSDLVAETQFFRLKYTNHPPLQIAFWIGDYLQEQHDRDRLNIYQLTSLQKLVDQLVDILGGCERILKTPLPLIYPLILKNLVFVYCLVIPLEIVKEVNWFTSSIITFVSFILLSIEQIGSEIEEPFGHNSCDLPLDIICNTILHNVEDLIALAPHNGSNSKVR
ncbi:hypothetical protein C7Y66_02810 [Chroococcidiopsis sp. CCALA 051]|nr:hypothetical protein C7Y66_02810 [Chroococcidiopsis sp. CCALA 051]